MQYRTLGRTGLKVSEIGYGAWGIGGGMWSDSDDTEAMLSLRKAFDLGVNFYDTALVYGDGHSESLVGELAKAVGRDKVVIASKIPPKNSMWPAECGVPISKVFPREHIRKSTEQSLRNLRVDSIDLHQLHVWQDHFLDEPDWLEELVLLKKEGLVRHVGVSINDHDPESAMLLVQTKVADVVQVIYNIFDQTPEEALYPLCEADNIGVIARVPFDEGGLTGAITASSKFEASDWRSDYFSGNRPAEVEERVKRLRPLLGKEAQTLPELALRFCLSNPAVSTVIPGMRKVRNVESNCAVSDGRRLSSDLIAELRTHAWKRNYYAGLH